MRIGHAEERRCAEGSACEDAEGAPRAVIAQVDARQGCAPRPLLRAPLLDAPFPTAAAPGTRKNAHSGGVLEVTCLTARVTLALHELRVWVEKRGPMANSGARRCLTVAVKQAGRRSNGGTETVEVSSRGAERNGIAGGTLGHGRCKTPRRVSNHGARWSRCRAAERASMWWPDPVRTPW